MTNGATTPSIDLVRPVYDQLMQHVRKQDDLIHSWTKYYLSIQAALAIALAFLIRLAPTDGVLVNAGGVFIPFLGVVTSICLTNIILREQFWQGRYIVQIRNLPLIPETYSKEWVPSEPNPTKRGYIGEQFWSLRKILITGWVIWGFLSLYRALWGS